MDDSTVRFKDRVLRDGGKEGNVTALGRLLLLLLFPLLVDDDDDDDDATGRDGLPNGLPPTFKTWRAVSPEMPCSDSADKLLSWHCSVLSVLNLAKRGWTDLRLFLLTSSVRILDNLCVCMCVGDGDLVRRGNDVHH